MINVHRLYESNDLTDYYNKIFSISKGSELTKLKYISYFIISMFLVKLVEFSIITASAMRVYNIFLVFYILASILVFNQIIKKIKLGKQKENLDIVTLLMNNEDLEKVSEYIDRDLNKIGLLDKVISEVVKNNKDSKLVLTYVEDKEPSNFRTEDSIVFPNLMFTRDGKDEFFVGLLGTANQKYVEVPAVTVEEV